MRLTLPALTLAALALAARPAHAQFETSEVSAPGSPTPFLLVKSPSDPGGIDLSWEPVTGVPGVTYTLYRRVPADGFRCLVSGLPGPSWSTASEAPAGAAWWYSVVGDDGWGENRHGNEVAIVERCPCGGPAPVAGSPALAPVLVASGFANPVHVTHAPGDRSRLFVVEQAGTIRVVKRGQVLATPFLDITTLVRSGGEQGLLSLGFHPRYPADPRFFVYYTARTPQGQLTIAEYRVSAADPDVADPSSGSILWSCAHSSASNHNGGQLAFGPLDGYLYFSPGDGGGSCDPSENAENLGSCLGKMHRIDIDSASPFAIPPTNPFVGQVGPLPEIWAYGLRNAWRFAFDRLTGDLYIADVGQNQWEEVNVQPAASPGGENYGWDMYEGDRHCYASCNSSGQPPCDPAGKTWPVLEYSHSVGLSITGGHVYRGCRAPGYRGTYFYADYATNIVRSFVWSGGVATDLRDWAPSLPGPSIFSISSFGEDAQGEIYLIRRQTAPNGAVFRIEPQ